MSFIDIERKRGESLEDFRKRLEEEYKKDRDRKENEFKETQIKH